MEKSSAPPPSPEPGAAPAARTLGRQFLLTLASFALAIAFAEARRGVPCGRLT